MEAKLMTYDFEIELLLCWMREGYCRGARKGYFTNQNFEEKTISERSVVKEVEAVNIIREGVPTQLIHTLREGDTLTN
ncbi:hypothetical protein H5410_015799, partial [Solanum commersonii]